MLDNLLKLTNGAPLLDLEQRLWYACQRLTALDLLVLERVQDEDLAIINACLEVEHELREPQFAALDGCSRSLSGRMAI